MYWSSSWAIDKIIYYVQRVFLPPPSPVLANIHSIVAYDVPRTKDVDLPTKFRFNVGPASQPIDGSISVNCLRRWPSTNPSLGLLYTMRKHVTSPNAVSMLTHNLQRWPDIETASGDRTVFSDCCIIMRVTLSIPAPETPDSTMHCPNADVMLVHCL